MIQNLYCSVLYHMITNPHWCNHPIWIVYAWFQISPIIIYMGNSLSCFVVDNKIFALKYWLISGPILLIYTPNIGNIHARNHWPIPIPRFKTMVLCPYHILWYRIVWYTSWVVWFDNYGAGYYVVHLPLTVGILSNEKCTRLTSHYVYSSCFLSPRRITVPSYWIIIFFTTSCIIFQWLVIIYIH